ncbi:MAG: ATP-grasp domain-containing protein [Deltaproteobacteria bacterium]|nr:ATP-grasp domain-containing protein [Deltaproteobacteria bacterium]
MRVVFLAPSYPPEMIQYCRGLAEVGAQVIGIGDTPRERLPESVKRYLSGYVAVPRIMDEDDVVARATAALRGQSIDRVWTNWEPLVILAAKLRERWGLPGMSVDTVRGFRDKELMKERVRAAGLRTPRSARAFTADDVRAAAEQIDYPLIVKPIAGAGSANTYRVGDRAELERVLGMLRGVTEVSVEEYVEGEEFTYDTVCIEGRPAFENVAQYLPKPLEARSNEWISPVIITVRDLEQAKIRKGRELGRKVLSALGMGSGYTHMEWFFTPKGEAIFGEIGCRPGGAHLVDQMNHTCDIDLFREWARVAAWSSFEAPTTRLYNCGIVFKRAKGQGRITGIFGLDHWKQRYGRFLVEDQLLRPGAHRRDWKQTLVSDGYLLVRHPDWDAAKEICFAAATDVTMFAS